MPLTVLAAGFAALVGVAGFGALRFAGATGANMAPIEFENADVVARRIRFPAFARVRLNGSYI